jgi:ABC-type branched-subunit amino acid transport system substrate-binding protein
MSRDVERDVVTDEDEGAGDTTIPLSKARKLVEQDNVDLITGLVASPNALAVRAYVDQNQVRSRDRA